MLMDANVDYEIKLRPTAYWTNPFVKFCVNQVSSSTETINVAVMSEKPDQIQMFTVTMNDPGAGWQLQSKSGAYLWLW